MLGWAYALGVLCIWSSWVIIARLSATLTLTVWDVTALRFGTAGLLMLPWALRWGLGGLPLGRALWLAMSSGAPYAALGFLGFLFAPAAHGAVLINGTLPLFTLVLSWCVVRQTPTHGQAIGAFLVLAGCAAIGGDGLLAPMPGLWKGHLFFLTAAGLLSSYLVFARKWSVTMRHSVVAVPLGGLLLYLPLYMLADLPSFLKQYAMALWPWNEVALQIGFQGVVVSLLGLPIFTRANALLGSAAMSALTAAVPAVATLLAIPFLGETPSLLAFVGVGVVTLGVLFTMGVVRAGSQVET